MVNDYIQQAIQGIEAEQEQKVEEAKSKAMLDVAEPNAEIDVSRDKAIEELKTKLNQDVAALQEQFTKERQDIIDASEKQKAENINTRISIETASVTAQYGVKLAGLRKLLED